MSEKNPTAHRRSVCTSLLASMHKMSELIEFKQLFTQVQCKLTKAHTAHAPTVIVFANTQLRATAHFYMPLTISMLGCEPTQTNLFLGSSTSVED
jgi:hypothetical protein